MTKVTQRIDRPSGPPQLLERRSRSGGSTWLLPNGKSVGLYRDRVLYKRVRLDAHYHRKRGGIGLNLELLARLDRVAPAPKELVIVRLDTEAGITPPPMRVPWHVVKAFALAAIAGDARYLIAQDLDAQVVLPWAACNGELEAPPPEGSPSVPPANPPVAPPSRDVAIPGIDVPATPPDKAPRDRLPKCEICLGEVARGDRDKARTVRRDAFGAPTRTCNGHAASEAHRRLLEA